MFFLYKMHFELRSDQNIHSAIIFFSINLLAFISAYIPQSFQFQIIVIGFKKTDLSKKYFMKQRLRRF